MNSTKILKDRRWQVQFQSHGDRWGHTIGVWSGDRLMPFLASCEGTESEHWPPSPPLTEVHIDTSLAKPTAMLVGMSGDSHWSITVQLDTDRASLQFDVACRIKTEPPEFTGLHSGGWGMGSCYRSMICPTDCTNHELRFVMDQVKLGIVTADQADVPAATIVADENMLYFSAESQPGSLPRTIRWQYRLTDIAGEPALK
ncbi:MAG: hypothetical protein WBF93_13465 [Pirellulales bacterium]